MEHPILFSRDMIIAILTGKKTMTRRIVKTRSHISEIIDGWPYEMTDDDQQPIRCPYGEVGDILWVRETHAWCDNEFYDDGINPGGWVYKSDFTPELAKEFSWKPSIYMPRRAARIFLKVTNIRCEYLQDITEEDAKREGVVNLFEGQDISVDAYVNYSSGKIGWDVRADNAVHSFQTLWDKINGTGKWDKNQLVWVVEFEFTDNPNA